MTPPLTLELFLLVFFSSDNPQTMKNGTCEAMNHKLVLHIVMWYLPLNLQFSMYKTFLMVWGKRQFLTLAGVLSG